MPNICVKNVYSQRINQCISSDLLSTIQIKQNINIINWWLTRFIQVFILFFYNLFSTTLKLLFNLLNKSFTHNPQHLLIRLIKEN